MYTLYHSSCGHILDNLHIITNIGDEKFDTYTIRCNDR